MTLQEKKYKMESILSSYLGLSDIVKTSIDYDLPLYLDFVKNRMIQLREEHDELATK
jgi:hypothetical protein